ncbi:MAG TPA: HD domain-containing phosphohydrolase, partial [Longimicrobiales bacterium]|nr:HD domain-containing phosphohydrolase [Longimicrobiales bacterium]
PRSAPAAAAPRPRAPEPRPSRPRGWEPRAPTPRAYEPQPPDRGAPGAAESGAVGGAGRAGAAEEQWLAAADPLADAPAHTKSLIALTDMLVGLLEYRDPFFRGSSSLTRLLATSVAEEMGLSTEQRVDLALAAVLRDLGRVALGGKLVASSRIPPSGEARRRIERHVDLALHLMEGIDLPKAVRLAVRHHHERWDGAGYPDALSGEKIPMLARILAVVDSFAAMVSPRPYRLPRKVPEAAAELQEEAGTRYDPEVVNALIRVLARREQPHLGFVQRHHIVMVNPDQPGALISAAKLCSAGYLAEVAVDASTARERLRRIPVAALIISAACGADATAALIRELRVDPQLAGIPIVVSEAAGVALRVRLLETGADVCFPPGVRHAELQGTIGALVRRTLRPAPTGDGGASSPDAPWLALQGDIQDFPLTWLLQVMKYDSRTAAIGIRGARGEGAIYLRTGDAVHAQIRGGASGETALRQMLHWKKGRFTVQPDARPKEQTITTSIMHLLLAQAVDEDHAAAGIFGAVSAAG